MSPPLAAATVWWGMVGGGFPDWLDLRSDYSRSMKHRGISHSVLAAAMITLGFWALLGIVGSGFTLTGLPRTVWAYAFGLGYLSHIIADACTHAGVRLWLPFSQRKWWLLPKLLRGTSAGRLDTFTRIVTLIVIGVYLASWWFG